MRGMYTEAILKLIAERPGIRSVEIADQIDCDVDAVENSIKEQIESGFIRREIITAPNGRPTPAFWMKGVSSVVSVPEVKVPVVPKAVAPAPAAAPAVEAPLEPPALADEPAAPTPELRPEPEAPAASPAPVTTATRTKVDMAMAFIRSQPDRTASDDDFRTLLGLRKDQHPSTFLSTQRRKGLIHKDHDLWRLGPRRTVAEQPVAQAVPQIAGQSDAAEFRCALWSDGELQLARGEKIAMRLSADEVGQLRNYLRTAA